MFVVVVFFFLLVASFNLVCLKSSEWHSDSQDPQVYDEPTASEEANGKKINT